MEQRNEPDVSPYRVFSRSEWANLREDTPMTLTSKNAALEIGTMDPHHGVRMYV